MPLKPWYKVVTPREDLENSFGTGFHIHFEKQIDANQLFKNSASSIKKLAIPKGTHSTCLRQGFGG